MRCLMLPSIRFSALSFLYLTGQSRRPRPIWLAGHQRSHCVHIRRQSEDLALDVLDRVAKELQAILKVIGEQRNAEQVF